MSEPAPETGTPADPARLEAPAVRRRATVIVNPYAAGVTRRLRDLVVDALGRRFAVTACDTGGPGDAVVLARACAAGDADLVVTLGGDGTINEAANGLAGSNVPLFPLPGGSQNVFAKMLGIPADVVDATTHLVRLADHWHPRRVDLGRVDGRHFTFSAGAGLDASVVEYVDAHPEPKARWRQWYYALSAIRVFMRRYAVHPPRIEALAPDGPVSGVTVVVQNGDPYTYFGRRPVRVCEEVSLESATLSAAVLERATPVDLPGAGVRLLSRRLEVVRHRHVRSLPGLHELVVRAGGDEPFAVQVDGDFLGTFAVARFAVAPAALAVLA